MVQQGQEAQFMFDAEAMRRIGSPWAPEVLATGRTAQGTSYILLKPLTGQWLRGLIDKGAPLSSARAVEIACSAAAAISRIHEVGLLVLNLAPDTLFLTADGRVVLVDFGAAHTISAGPRLFCPSDMGYAAPEQIRGEAPDQRTDVWALGALLFELLEGRPAFPAGSATADGTTAASPPRLSGSGAALQLVLNQALAPLVAQRYASADDFAAALRHIHPQLALTHLPTPRRIGQCRRIGRTVFATAVALLLAFFIWHHVAPPTELLLLLHYQLDTPDDLADRMITDRSGNGYHAALDGAVKFNGANGLELLPETRLLLPLNPTSGLAEMTVHLRVELIDDCAMASIINASVNAGRGMSGWQLGSAHFSCGNQYGHCLLDYQDQPSPVHSQQRITFVFTKEGLAVYRQSEHCHTVGLTHPLPTDVALGPSPRLVIGGRHLRLCELKIYKGAATESFIVRESL